MSPRLSRRLSYSASLERPGTISGPTVIARHSSGDLTSDQTTIKGVSKLHHGLAGAGLNVDVNTAARAGGIGAGVLRFDRCKDGFCTQHRCLYRAHLRCYLPVSRCRHPVPRSMRVLRSSCRLPATLSLAVLGQVGLIAHIDFNACARGSQPWKSRSSAFGLGLRRD